MSKYTIEGYKDLIVAWVPIKFTVDAMEFIACEDEDDVCDAFWELVYENTDTGNVEYKDSELYNIELPEDLLKEWKRLKGL